MSRILLFLGASAIASAPGCGVQSDGFAAGRLRVAAASDLQTVLPSVIDLFQQDRGILVEPVFGSSGRLARQIGQGGPFDLFLSADRDYVEKLASEGAIDGATIQPYTRGSLVLAVNRKSGAAVQSLADLARPEIRKIAVANPAFAPYGAAAMQAIERSGLGERVAGKIVTADSVRHALQFVQTGNAEAGLVAHAIAAVPEVETIAVAAALYDPIDQYLGITTRSNDRSSAALFAEFLRGAAAQDVLRRHGFLRVEPAQPAVPAAKAEAAP